MVSSDQIGSAADWIGEGGKGVRPGMMSRSWLAAGITCSWLYCTYLLYTSKCCCHRSAPCASFFHSAWWHAVACEAHRAPAAVKA
ncbi:hypothetical protein M431DRAFT_181033 [Trichoderma harzianum CBS 226.95]|uniref:Uncharacterized protein n=1 Tax=Trichoderma harzianum CBS 226.95 TaxID=983964 RepID=A0A2T4ATP4_TRIHA|nr:hypothetical protein M431DRAFT_181033 [Trichoderma harzianum CBS 226.95]PTB60435.1 hypothetical protein M431DRAFT_181033 [Trichoderma harzianum CBS 226.95]